jgi:hypothetical protein
LPAPYFTMKTKTFRMMNTVFASSHVGDPAEIRTPDTLLKRQVLCRLSYWVKSAGADSARLGWDGRI